MMEFKGMKFWIGDDPDLSERVQNALFSVGYGWVGGGKVVQLTYAFALYADSCGNITYGTSEDLFDSRENEINIDWMRTSNKETVELNGKTYHKSELEEALKHINPIE